MPTTQTHLSELATTVPAATRIFHRHRLDYCCGGKRPLAEACAESGLDADAILGEILAAATPTDAPLSDRSPAEIAAYVVERYHEPLREDLPRLTAMAQKVERVHGDKPGCPLGLGAHLETWCAALLEHLDKEEQMLFPSLDTPELGIVAALMREHDDHAEALSRNRELTDDMTPPAHACTTWRALYTGLESLEREMMEHVHIENHVLFPRAAAR
jgi:regulator of cell morphogenesis and NO signaling